ncbi:MAG: metal ABC transporter permease, partial [Bacteroidetes bacterium]
MFQNPFVINALAAGLLSGLAGGTTGSFVVARRISFLAGGIAHAVLGGMGLAVYLGFNPMAGALLFAVLSAVIIALVKIKLHKHEDTLIGAIWAIGMAVGIIFISLTPGYNTFLFSFLFGNIMLVDINEIYMLLVMNVLILTIVFLFFRQFVFVSFDEEYAKLRGLAADKIYVLLLVIVALTVVVLMQAVGLILVIALLTLPAAIAEMFSGSMKQTVLISVVLSILFCWSGVLISFPLSWPAGPTIIILSGVI